MPRTELHSLHRHRRDHWDSRFGRGRITLTSLCGMVLLLLVFMRTGWRLSRLDGLALVVIAITLWSFDLSNHSP